MDFIAWSISATRPATTETATLVPDAASNAPPVVAFVAWYWYPLTVSVTRLLFAMAPRSGTPRPFPERLWLAELLSCQVGSATIVPALPPSEPTGPLGFNGTSQAALVDRWRVDGSRVREVPPTATSPKVS